MEKKTVQEWLNLIPDSKIRDRALANMIKSSSQQPRRSLTQAISSAFIFSNTPERAEYWWDVIDKYSGFKLNRVDRLEIF